MAAQQTRKWILSLAANGPNSQGYAEIPWQLSKTAKEKHIFLGSLAQQPRNCTLSLAAQTYSQGK